MDWNKAKSILIWALLITDLILAGVYISGTTKAYGTGKTQAEDCALYFEQRGVEINAELPFKPKKLAVLKVAFSEGPESDQFGRTEYKGTALEIIGAKADSIAKIERGKTRIQTLPASSALLKLLPRILEDGQQDVQDIELIYYIDRSEYKGSGGEDTALIYWKITTESKVYYSPAYQE